MAVKALAVLASLLAVTPAAAQTLTVEADATAGISTEDTRVVSTQARLFGSTAGDWRYYGDVSIGAAWGNQTDAFSSAYPYDRKFRPIETYIEKVFHPGGAILAVKGGRYREPFGIHGRGEHGYSGFTRAPLIRYGQAFALSNTFLCAGGDAVFGAPHISGEVSIGVPADEGVIERRHEFEAVMRVQAYYKSFIVGASRMDTGRDSALGSFARGRMVFNGVDGRWGSSGVQLRGEWISGRPFDGVTTDGGYLDAIVHRPGMGPITAVGRIEKIDYDAGRFSFYYTRVTAGTHVRFNEYLSAQVSVLHQPEGLADNRTTALDAGITFTIRR
jgi:hypothetical protein